MRIGAIARAAGVNIQTIRFYEREGILPEPPRTASGYRNYGADAIKLVRFVKAAQGLGFTLAEAQDLLRLRDNESPRCNDVRALASEKLEAVEAKLRQLESLRDALAGLVDACGTADAALTCPIIEALDEEGEHHE